MRIRFVCKSLPATYKGGIQTHVWSLTGELLKSGCQVNILTAGFGRNTWIEGRRIIKVPYLPGKYFPLGIVVSYSLAVTISQYVCSRFP